MTSSSGYSSLRRGLEILSLVRDAGRMKTAELAVVMDLPLSTTYRYVVVLRNAGYLMEVDGLILPSERLAGPEHSSTQMADIARPILRHLRYTTQMSALLAVRVHTAAICIEASFAHPKHKIAFQKGQARALSSSGTALPLLAYAPSAVQDDIFAREPARHTALTPRLADLPELIAQLRREGYIVSRGHLTPGMIGIGVPLMAGSTCLGSLSLVGDEHGAPDIPRAVAALRAAASDLAADLQTNISHVKDADDAR